MQKGIYFIFSFVHLCPLFKSIKSTKLQRSYNKFAFIMHFIEGGMHTDRKHIMYKIRQFQGCYV